MSLSFNPDEGLIIVPTKLTGPSGDVLVRLALDTGATTTLIGWARAVLVGCDPAAATERMEVTTASGLEFMPRIRLHAVRALGRERTDFPVLCHTLPPSATVDGVLGLDFLRGARVLLDFVKGTIEVQ